MRDMARSALVLALATFWVGAAFGTDDISAGLPVQILDARTLEDLPVQSGGRKKPFLTFAQETLLGIHGEIAMKSGGRTYDAVDVLAAIWVSPGGWEQTPLIRVGNKEFREAVGLESGRSLYSFEELAANASVLRRVDEVRARQRAEERPKLDKIESAANDTGVRMATMLELLDGASFAVAPPSRGAEERARWLTIPMFRESEALDAADVGTAWDAMHQAYAESSQTGFEEVAQRLVGVLRAAGGKAYPSQYLVGLEHVYQTLRPHRIAWVLYAAAALTLVLTGRTARKSGYAAAWVLALGGLALQIFGFYARVAVAGRPPVTNMYESVIWAGFGAAFFGLLLEAIYRSRYYLLAAAPAAMLSLFVADSQPAILDPAINPLMPVLRDNFWLATHVLAVVSSYAAFLLALALGHIVLGRVIATGRIDVVRPIYQHVYRAMQIGVLLLATGVVLGAFWANYSWGRFWDWDPKETWSLVALLSYLFILHGRIAGKWGGFGLSVGAVVAFLSVLMAWYGVNFVLGAGLHSYGFGSGGFEYALGFVVLELTFVGVAIWRGRKASSGGNGHSGGLAEHDRVLDDRAHAAGALGRMSGRAG